MHVWGKMDGSGVEVEVEVERLQRVCLAVCLSGFLEDDERQTLCEGWPGLACSALLCRLAVLVGCIALWHHGDSCVGAADYIYALCMCIVYVRIMKTFFCCCLWSTMSSRGCGLRMCVLISYLAGQA